MADHSSLASAPVEPPREGRAPLRPVVVRPVAVLAVLLGVLGFAGVAAGSWIPSLWGDEAASIMSAERSWPSLFTMLGHVDAVHGGYYVFLHVWIDLFGASAFSVRLPSALATGIATAGLVVLANRLGGRRLAVVSGLVYMIIPRVTYIGVEGRSWALSAACATWLTVLLVHLVRTRCRRRLAWLGYAVLLAISIYVFLFLMVMAIVHAVILLSASREWRMLRRWLVATAMGLVLAAPVVVYGIAERGQISFLADRVTTGFRQFFVDQWFWAPPFALAAWICIAGSVVALTACWWHGRSQRRAQSEVETAAGDAIGQDGQAPALPVVTLPVVTLPVVTLPVVTLAWFVIPPVLLLAANLVVAVYTSRYMSFVAPAIALMIGIGVCLLRRRWVSAVAVAVLVVLAAPHYLDQRGPYGMPGGSDWAEVAGVMAREAHPGDAIVFTEGGSPSANPRSAKYLYPQAFRGLDDVTLAVPYTRNTGLWDVTVPIPQAAGALAHSDGRVWLIRNHGLGASSSATQLGQLHRLGYTLVRTIKEHRDTIYLLVKAGPR